MRKVLAGLLFLSVRGVAAAEVAPELTILLQSCRSASRHLPGSTPFSRQPSHDPGLSQVEKEWGRRGLYRAEGETPQAYLERMSLKVPEVEDLCSTVPGLYYPIAGLVLPSEGSPMRDMRAGRISPGAEKCGGSILKIVVMDLDGTLVDSFETSPQRLIMRLHQFDEPPLPTSTVRKHVGHGLVNLLKGLLPMPGRPTGVDRAVDM